jgi:hypothetical protein
MCKIIQTQTKLGENSGHFANGKIKIEMTNQSQAHENAYGCITHLVRPGSQLKTLLRLGTRRIKLPAKPMLIPIGPPFAIIYADCH